MARVIAAVAVALVAVLPPEHVHLGATVITASSTAIFGVLAPESDARLPRRH